MKNLIFYFTFFFYSAAFYSQWIQESFPSTDNLFCVYFFNDQIGWISGGNNSEGYIYRTDDGGINWIKTVFNDTYELEDIFFINENIGWAVGDSGIVMKTSNGGISWDRQNSGTKSYLSDVFFLDENNGWICYGYSEGFPSTTYYGVILHTTNGGDDWLVQKEADKYQFRSIHFINSNTGWAVGSNHQNKTEIYATNDGGTTWEAKLIDTIWRTFYSIHFCDNLNGWMTGESGIILNTTDSGNSWLSQTNGFQNYYLKTCFAVNQQKVYSAGRYGNLLYTTDGGANWNNQESGTENTINSIFFINNLAGWAVGYGVVLSTKNGGVTSIEENISEIPAEFFLSQNYPNPFNPSTNIYYSVSEFQMVTLKIYDLFGREVEVLISEQKAPGIYEVTFDLSKSSIELSSGIYYYALKAGDHYQAKKMILLK